MHGHPIPVSRIVSSFCRQSHLRLFSMLDLDHRNLNSSVENHIKFLMIM
ncbi:hypothetical protein V6N12_050849 [Hibiscus sabdariffa]|uniref:Uncharacterized protein n=1 Tax=Hibiscus sabdariffa TaxID=183260 RepID=A0ABR2GDL1_9ROSI